MGLLLDSAPARRAANRFRSTAESLDRAVGLGLTALQRRIVPEFIRDARATHNLKAVRLRESTATKRGADSVRLGGLDRETGLLNYGARASRYNGVTVTVLHATGASHLRSAFAAVGLNDNRHIFQRRGAKRVMRKGNYIGYRRQPIVALYGPSTAQILRDPARQERLISFAQRILSAEVARVLDRWANG